MYKSCVRETMLYSSQCLALRQEGKKRLEGSERPMWLWLCNIKKEQSVNTNFLLSQLKLKSLDSLLRCNRLHWFRYVNQSEQVFGLEVEGNRNRGRLKKCWLDTIKNDLKQCNLQAETCQNRSEGNQRMKTASRTNSGHVKWVCVWINLLVKPCILHIEPSYQKPIL